MNNISIVCVDVETTGLTKNQDAVMDIGAVKIVNNQIVDSFQSLVQPNQKILPYVQRLTGITPQVLDGAPTFSEIADSFRTFLEGSIFVSHGGSFDFDSVNNEFIRLGQRPLNQSFIDSLDIATIIYPHLLSHKLVELAQYCNIQFENHHRAFPDAECLGKILITMINELHAIHPIVLRDSQRFLKGNFAVVREFLSLFITQSPLLKKLEYTSFLSPSYPHSGHQNPPVSVDSHLADNKVRAFIDDILTGNHCGIVEQALDKDDQVLKAAISQAVHTRHPIIIGTVQDDHQISAIVKDCGGSAMVVKRQHEYIDIRRFDILYRYYLKRATSSDGLLFLGLLSWLLKTTHGRLDELHPRIYQRFYNKVCFVDGNSVEPNGNFPCFIDAAKKAMQNADVIVTDYSTIFMNHTNRNQWMPILPVFLIDIQEIQSKQLYSWVPIRYNDGLFQSFVNRFMNRREEGFITLLRRSRSLFFRSHQGTMNQLISKMKKEIAKCETMHKDLLIATLGHWTFSSSSNGKREIIKKVTKPYQLFLKQLGILELLLRDCRQVVNQYNSNQMRVVLYTLDGIVESLEWIKYCLNKTFSNYQDFDVMVEANKKKVWSRIEVMSVKKKGYFSMMKDYLASYPTIVFIGALEQSLQQIKSTFESIREFRS